MELFVMSFVVFTLAMLGMALGVFCGRRHLEARCGPTNGVEGIATMGGGNSCLCEQGERCQGAVSTEVADRGRSR